MYYIKDSLENIPIKSTSKTAPQHSKGLLSKHKDRSHFGSKCTLFLKVSELKKKKNPASPKSDGLFYIHKSLYSDGSA